MNDITPKEAIANLNHLYGMVAPDIQRSIDVAIKCMKERPKGDLISREALKGAIENQDKFACLPDTKLVPFRMLNEPEKNYEPYVHLRDIRNAIDNVPTVPQVTVFAENADEKAVADLKAELQNVVEARPQNKWIKIFENPFTNGYVCPFCGHKIQVTEQFLPQVTECEACGADMKGGAE